MNKEDTSLTDKFMEDWSRKHPWLSSRLPDMLWAALIISNLERDQAIRIFHALIDWLEHNKEGLGGLGLTDIAKYPTPKRKEFLRQLMQADPKMAEILKPLLVLKVLPGYPSWRAAINLPFKDTEAWQELYKAVAICGAHWDEAAIDCRWLRFMGLRAVGRAQFSVASEKNQLGILGYPDVGSKRHVQNCIKFQDEAHVEFLDTNWPQKFWAYNFKYSNCLPELDGDDEEREQYLVRAEQEKEFYHKQMAPLRRNFVHHFLDNQTIDAKNKRHEVLFGLSLYGLDIFGESILTLSSSSLTGRLHAQALLNTYCQLAFLMKEEQAGNPLWNQYRQHGYDKLEALWEKFETAKIKIGMFSKARIADLLDEDYFIQASRTDMDNWIDGDLKARSRALGQSKIYDKYATYTAGFLQADWGAVRETSLQACINHLHRFHRLPQMRLPIHLPGSNEDNRQLINRILALADKAYPEFKDRIKKPPAAVYKTKVDQS